MLVRGSFHAINRETILGAANALCRRMLIVFSLNPYITTGSSQLFPRCQTYILSKETADRTTCCFPVALPCFSPFPTSLGLLKSAGREPGAHHFNAVQNGICIIICEYVRETAQLWICEGLQGKREQLGLHERRAVERSASVTQMDGLMSALRTRPPFTYRFLSNSNQKLMEIRKGRLYARGIANGFC